MVEWNDQQPQMRGKLAAATMGVIWTCEKMPSTGLQIALGSEGSGALAVISAHFSWAHGEEGRARDLNRCGFVGGGTSYIRGNTAEAHTAGE